jgi:hypothetical protein
VKSFADRGGTGQIVVRSRGTTADLSALIVGTQDVAAYAPIALTARTAARAATFNIFIGVSFLVATAV